MNQQSKRAIKSLVLTLRHKLEDDIGIQLKRYGFAGERWLPLERLSHIERDDQAASNHYRLKAALEQQLRRMGVDLAKAKPQQRGEAVEWFVREIAFTHLNRLVALKCLEVRDLIPEIITTREAYGGRSRAHYDYRNAHPNQARQPDDALPAAIRQVCQRVYAEFKFLFDVGDPLVGRHPPSNSILWPSYPVLKECIALINNLDAEAGLTQHATRNTSTNLHHPTSNFQPPNSSLWAEDEILGWIYQFYNAEHKEAIRKRGKPRRPAEVAVINQFFTPRWIVKFLVDNTLGRLWLEMHPDSERVRAKCDYLVPEPLPADESEIENRQSKIALDPDSPINDPHAPPRREPKPVTEIRLIDPACGTMHFGHYAFEVFQEIYLDALNHGWPIASGETDSQIANRKSQIANLILRHNLYGVDIDLRAVQLAGLSLFIKAKTANPNAHISHVNLVVADAVLPADGARQRFLDQYKDDKVVQDAVRQVLDDMENVAEVGSLLRVEERLRDILAKAGHAAVRDWDAKRQRELPGLEPETRQLSLAEVSGAVPEQWGAHYTLARLLGDLRAFAAEALQTHDLNAQLFAEEAEKSVHLLDVFLNDYDVVVMNPPYGIPLNGSESVLKSLYPTYAKNVACAFVERAFELAKDGFVGALVDKTFSEKTSYRAFREQILLEPSTLKILLDLGWGVLDDAYVEVAALVLANRTQKIATCLDLTIGIESVDDVLISIGSNSAKRHLRYDVPLEEFRHFPNSALAYRAPRSVRSLFVTCERLADVINVTAHGAQGAADRYYRYTWEVDQARTGAKKDWAYLWNGSPYSPFYVDTFQVVFWRNGGEQIKNDPKSIMSNEQYFFREGVSWGKRGDILDVQYLPPGRIFTVEGQAAFPDSHSDCWNVIALLNSSLQRYLINLYCGQHKYGGYVGELPFKRGNYDVLVDKARESHDLRAAWDTGNEICTRFDAPWLVQIYESANQRTGESAGGIAEVLALLGEDAPQIMLPDPPTLGALLDAARAIEQAADARLQDLQAQIDEAVYELYEISAEDRALIERELGDRPPELVWPQMERKSDKEKRREHVRRLVSYFLLQALQEKRDGILPLTHGAGQTTALDEVRRRMEAGFGEEAAFRMESDIKQVLGQSIADWLDGPFVKWHTKLYKKRPIIWHLASPRNLFACFVYIHKLDRDTLRKVQTLYLWPRRRAAEAELETARAEQAHRRIDQAEALLDDLAELEKRLLAVIQGELECDTPDWAEGPYRGGAYDPVLDDGVTVNIAPLQEAGVLRYRKVV